jgi:hypothetical protein
MVFTDTQITLPGHPSFGRVALRMNYVLVLGGVVELASVELLVPAVVPEPDAVVAVVDVPEAVEVLEVEDELVVAVVLDDAVVVLAAVDEAALASAVVPVLDCPAALA